MATAAALIQTLAGIGNDTAKARILRDEQDLQKKQILSQLATQEQARKVQMRYLSLDEQMARLGQLYPRHLQSKNVIMPDGSEAIVNFDPTSGKYYDQEGKEVTGVKPKVTGGLKLGPWQPPTKDAPVIGGMRMWSRDIVNPQTGLPSGNKQYGVPSTAVLPTEQHKFKQVTDIEGNTYLVPVTESSGKVVPQTGGGGGTAPRTNVPRGTSKSKTGTTTTDTNVPSNAIPFGHKPIDAMSRRALVAANEARDGMNRLMSLYLANPKLANDNNPITSAVNWLEYGSGHFEPSDPVRSKLIKEAALIGITASGLYSQGRMSRYLFEKAQQHLPQPNDTPKLLFSKISWLVQNHILDDAIKYIKNPFSPAGGDTPDAVEGEIEINGKKIKVKQ